MNFLEIEIIKKIFIKLNSVCLSDQTNVEK